MMCGRCIGNKHHIEMKDGGFAPPGWIDLMLLSLLPPERKLVT